MTETNDPHKNRREAGGRFAPGNTIGAAGRPKGSRNRTTIMAEALLDGQAEALSQKAIQIAMTGDVTALRLCLDKIMPARKDRLIEVDLPKITSAEEAANAMTSLIEKVADGQLSPSEADAIAGLIERRTKIVEAHEFELRLRALEQRA